jgi:hypothetical protein
MHDMKNYPGRSLCYHPKPMAEVGITQTRGLIILHIIKPIKGIKKTSTRIFLLFRELKSYQFGYVQ